MKKLLLLSVGLATGLINAQSYPPPAGQTGSTAIHYTSGSFVAWATGATITRGKQDISNGSSSYASFGTASEAVGSPNGSTMTVVSLGDGGNAVVTFAQPITDGSGYDFAVFENSFSDTFLELAYVEVSSDGTNFFRFPAHSETQTSTQIGGFGSVDCRYLNNLAGKYKLGYGTPFDLADIPNNASLNKNAITHVKIIDVVGSINASYATYDSYGNKVNDPFTTPFASGGFDLDAVGVINQGSSSRMSPENVVARPFSVEFKFYPNPATDVVYFKSNAPFSVKLYDITGRTVKVLEEGNHEQLTVTGLPSGNYLLEVINGDEKIVKNIIVRQ
ncbi:T9SS type A sorting domain-containing protein [Flavobacterium amniphilum]|uniref:T9SS type A sorting domain-containing protein n=1 Tax=Flavobacterium amniphilum TaxID=1834035 RepID=UPI00202A6E68|nr:T9SS type A sorting domain-containing protein [Flavobacterium amniphilum]MCL9807230.1 T9SS type A sorting domain-containing protein [Flavobacterium amniphilum]